jgi:hypothetical protein
MEREWIQPISVDDVVRQEHREYVAAPTQADREWLAMVRLAYREQADRLSIDLGGAY